MSWEDNGCFDFAFVVYLPRCAPDRFTDSHRYPPHHVIRILRPLKVHLYTGVQFVWLVLIWITKLNHSIAHFFPLVVLAMLPFRMYVMPFLYSERELQLLDGKEDDHDGQKYRKKS